MNDPHKPLWFAHRADRMDAFKADPPATKIQALRIIERGETMRFAIRLLLIAATGIVLNYWPALAGWLKVAF